MKIRYYITFITLFLYGITSWLFTFLYSPIAGVATAQTVNEDISAFVWAKFVRDGDFNVLIFCIAGAILILTWGSLLFSSEKSKKNNRVEDYYKD